MRRFVLTFLTMIFTVFVYSSVSFAQDQQEFLPPDAIENLDMEKMAFPDTRYGCSKKMAFFTVVKSQYKRGRTVQEVANIKMFEPVVDKFYTQLREDGPEKATLKNMQGYANCLAEAQSKKLEEDNPYKVKRIASCDKVNAMVFDVVQSIQNRKNKQGLIEKYSNMDAQFSSMGNNPMTKTTQTTIDKMYELAEKGSIENSIDFATIMTVNCYPR